LKAVAVHLRHRDVSGSNETEELLGVWTCLGEYQEVIAGVLMTAAA
jgi:hypothetical protein